MEHGPDEHPEIPLIRRASLHLDQQTVSDPVEPEEDEAEEAEGSKTKAASIREACIKGQHKQAGNEAPGYRYISYATTSSPSHATTHTSQTFTTRSAGTPEP